VNVRKATADDFAGFFNATPPHSFLAYVGEDEDGMFAMGGLAFHGGRAFGFFDAKRDVRFCKTAVHRTARRVLADAAAQGYRRVYASKSEQYPGAGKWLARLGFTQVDDDGQVYVWLNY
jgi:hypothetical protein